MFSSLTDIYNIFVKHPQVVTDSRDLKPSCMFFALRGERFNGNQFAAEAHEKGAGWVVIDEPEYKVSSRYILVEDVLQTLQDLARHHREQYNIPVIAVTGTNGKTTTKELINAVLSKKYKVVSTSGNLNNHIGVPLTLLRLGAETRIAVIEMGANHPGEIDFLCRIALPDLGIITNIGKAHLEGFGSFEGVVTTKTELYRFLAGSHEKVFVNCNDSLLMKYSEGLERITYGFSDSAWLQGYTDGYGSFSDFGIRQQNGQTMSLHSKLFGDYNAVNILASACIGRFFNVSDEDIKLAVGSYEPSNNRSQIKTTERNLLVLDSYNANPGSMEAALRSFAASAYKNKAVILGDMLELGNESDALHKHILALVEELPLPEVYLVGPVFARINTKREFLCFSDSELARLWFSHHRPEGRSLLLKGSRGIKLETIADVL